MWNEMKDVAEDCALHICLLIVMSICGVLVWMIS